MIQDLHGKWVLLTGAASGIGKEACFLLAHEGCNFVLVDVDAAGLRLVAEQLRSTGSEVIEKVVDLTDKGQILKLAEEVRQQVGTPDVLVNNAGIGHSCDLRHTTDEDWDRLMAINFFSALNLTNAFLPDMIQRGGGQIVNMSTGQVFYPVPTWGAYAASKAALATWSECLTWELACFKIRVTTVFPGLIKTPFYAEVEARNFTQKLVLWYINAMGGTPQKMALKIVKGIKRRKRRIIQSWVNWFSLYGKRLSPMGADIMGETFAWTLCDRRKGPRE